MKKTTKPTVTLLATGKDLVAKQMAAKAGDLLPKHSASVESMLYIIQGEGVLNIKGEELELKEDKTFVIPQHEKHQIKAITDFRALHFMPKNIKFEFFNS